MSIIDIQNNLIKYLKNLFEDSKYKNKKNLEVPLNIFKSFFPIKNYKQRLERNQEDGDVPFLLLRYVKDIQTLENGVYNAEVEWELIIGIYEESDYGYEIPLTILENIKKDFMEFSNKPKFFQIKQDLIETELLYEESQDFYWFASMKFKTHGIYYDSKIEI